MALAFGDFHELSHQLRFLLFEIGIGLPQNSIDYFITLAHKNALNRLQYAAINERLINAPIASHHVHDFMSQLEAKLKQSESSSQFFQWNTLRSELDESIANEALAHAYKHHWGIQIRQEVGHHKSLWSWINKSLSVHEALLFLKQWGSQDLAYYPASHAKLGFTRREVLQNSPEFQAKLSIHWCAIKKKQSSSSTQSSDFNQLICKSFPGEYQFWREKLVFKQLNPDSYSPIPIHPWQWRNKLQKIGAQLIDNKSLVLLPHHQTVMPSCSFDVVVPVHNPNIHIQLATGINTPDAKRSEPHDLILMNPAISHWINYLLTQTQNYQNSLYLLSNLGAIGVNDESIPEYLHKEFTASLHENPAHLLTSNKTLVPLASLFAITPITNSPLIIEIIQASGLNPMEYFSLYCHKIINCQLDFMLKFGVAFAASHNKSLVVFSNNKPEGIVICDIQNIKISTLEFYKDLGCPALPLDSKITTNTLEELGTYFIQGVLRNNISYWIDTLSNAYHLNSNHLWDIVKQVMQLYFNKLSNDIDPSVLNTHKQQLLHAPWQHQCTLTMHLKGNPHKDIYIKHMNPLNL